VSQRVLEGKCVREYESVWVCVSERVCIKEGKLIERNPPPRGGFLSTMFPDQEPCVRDFTTRCDRHKECVSEGKCVRVCGSVCERECVRAKVCESVYKRESVWECVRVYERECISERACTRAHTRERKRVRKRERERTRGSEFASERQSRDMCVAISVAIDT